MGTTKIYNFILLTAAATSDEWFPTLARQLIYQRNGYVLHNLENSLIVINILSHIAFPLN